MVGWTEKLSRWQKKHKLNESKNHFFAASQFIEIHQIANVPVFSFVFTRFWLFIKHVDDPEASEKTGSNDWKRLLVKNHFNSVRTFIIFILRILASLNFQNSDKNHGTHQKNERKQTKAGKKKQIENGRGKISKPNQPKIVYMESE